MGDYGASSSSSSNAGASGEGGGGFGETVVSDHGRRRSTCGYCRSTAYTSISHGLGAHSITVDDYQELLDRGWRRSGSFLYKPDMENTCCPSYTIRLKAGEFAPLKEQARVHKKMQRFLDGTIDMKGINRAKETSSASLPRVSQILPKESSASACDREFKEVQYIHCLETSIDNVIDACLEKGEFHSNVQLSKAVVKKVTPQAKRKLAELSEDLLYTCNISFQIAASLRRSQSAEKNICDRELSGNAANRNGESSDISPNSIATKLASLLGQQEYPNGLSIKACNGHLNVYSLRKQAGTFGDDICRKSFRGSKDSSKGSCTSDECSVLPQKRRKLEIRMKRSSFDPEEFALYKRYQIKVHDDKPEKVTESSYTRFLVDTPIIFVPPQSGHKNVPPCGFGSFHQQYIIDGKLVAVGVVDILPRCLSSKYLFWDPEFAFLSLGKYSALQEINWVKEAQVRCPSLQYYYLGYYIHSCRKMRYKAAYRPSELLCPLRYEWVPFDVATPLLDRRPYVILSNYLALQNGTSSADIHRSSAGQSGSSPARYLGNETSSDEEEMELDCGGLDPISDDELGPDTSSLSMDDDPKIDVSDVVIDMNGARVKFKDLQKVFGLIEKKHLDLLEKQLQRYVIAVGKKLADRILYALG